MIGLAKDIPLLVHSGGIHPARGVQTVLRALPEVPDAYLALVYRTGRKPPQLEKMAVDLGVADRFHAAGFRTARPSDALLRLRRCGSLAPVP